MTEQVTRLRIFVASPGDVAEERRRLRAVVNEINRAAGRMAEKFVKQAKRDRRLVWLSKVPG